MMIKDFDAVWQMLTLSSGANGAMELLLEKKCDEAELVLMRALRTAEELYISCEQAEDELKNIGNDWDSIKLRSSESGTTP